MSEIRLTEILEVLKKNPKLMYVSESLMVTNTVDGKPVVLAGDFKSIVKGHATDLMQMKADRFGL